MTPGAGGMTPGYEPNHGTGGLTDPSRTPAGNFSPFSSHHGAATPAGMSSFRGKNSKCLSQFLLDKQKGRSRNETVKFEHGSCTTNELIQENVGNRLIYLNNFLESFPASFRYCQYFG